MGRPRDNGDTLSNSPSKPGPATLKTGVTHARLDATSGVSLYVQLADIFRYNVMSGVWKRGHRLDNFETLAAQYQVARVTVQQAVARLVQEGILSSRRAKGTVVLGGVARLDNRGSAEVGDRGPGDDFAVQMLSKTVVQALPEDFQQGYAAFDSYVEINKVHVVRGIPYVLSRIFVPEEIFARFPAQSENDTKMLRLVLAYGRDNAVHLRQHTRVEQSDSVLSGHLNYPTGSPVARILRQVFGDDRRLAYAGMSWYRGDCFEMDMTLPREMIADSPLGLTTPTLRSS
jgi:GntR family transcriptional regulator